MQEKLNKEKISEQSKVIEKQVKQKKILSLIENEIFYYKYCNLKSFPRFTPTQPELLNLIDLYYLSQYRDNTSNEVFYNIVTLPVETADKQLDIDTKNVSLRPEGWASEFPSWIMEKELRNWLKINNFGKELNKYSFLLPKYGTLVVKKVGNEVVTVPVHNLRYRPDALDWNNTPIIEEHYYNNTEDFKAEAEIRGWEDSQLVVSNYNNGKKNGERLVVYELYLPPGYTSEENYYIVSKYGDILYSERKEKNIYKGMSFEDIPGRLIGRGQVEKLFDEQIYLNRIANYKADGFHWTSKHLFQTRDNTIGSNLLTDVDNGDILIVNSELTPVQVEERNLQAYSYDEQRWEENSRNRSFASEVMTGAGEKTGIPYRTTFLKAQLGGGFFEKKREELGLFVKEILDDWVIPEFKNQNRKEHEVLINNLLLDDDKSENFLNMIVEQKASARIKEMRAKGMELSPSKVKVLKAMLAELSKKENLKIEKGLYDDIKYTSYVDITGESVDIDQKISAYQTIAQIVGANPGVLYDPRTRRVFKNFFSAMGINPNDIMTSDKLSLEDVVTKERAEQGGSVAAPTGQMPMGTVAQQMTTV